LLILFSMPLVSPRRFVSATDRLTLVMLSALTVAAALTNPHPLSVCGVAVGLAFVVVALALAAERSRSLYILHDFSPVIFVPCVFNLAGPIVAALNHRRYDATLASLDERWLAPILGAWRGALGRPAWLVDAASVAYLSFYVIPVVIAGALYRRSRPAFDRFVFAIVATFFASVVGYAVFPATGPRVPDDLAARELGGGLLSEGARAFLKLVERNLLDAFPSGHAAVSLVALVLGWKLFPKWRAPLTFAVAGIWFSTVYLSLHYAIDLIAGGGVAVLILCVREPLGRGFGVSLVRDRRIATSHALLQGSVCRAVPSNRLE
jgi:membrane-associated phospholipid phosphatase